MSFIEMNHIRKQFGNLEVLKDVTLHMERGEVIFHYRAFRERQEYIPAVSLPA